MRWAKVSSAARFNLASSGMASLPLSALDVKIEQLEINGANPYGYEPLRRTIAERYRVPFQSVVSAIGTSMANYLALAATTEPGDEILLERPGYEPLVNTAKYLDLAAQWLPRPPSQSFQIDPAEIARRITPRTRVIAITNLHNPSGAFCSDGILRAVAQRAREVGAYVLVDEVYREMRFESPPRTAFHLDPDRFLVTNSLTKAYGLSGLRCGWIIAPPKIAERIWSINDLHSATFVHPGELLSVIAFQKLPEIADRAQRMLNANRKLLRDFLDSRDDLDCFWPEHGAIVFPRLRRGDVEQFCELLRSKFETSVVPGKFFDAPDHFRIGVGGPTPEVREGLARLGKALDTAARA